jgi:protein-S-isoprenylcysteine O-methyltransferase
MTVNSNAIFLVICVVWISSEIALVLFRRTGIESTSRDSGSVVRLNVAIYGSVAAAIAIGMSGIGIIPGIRLMLAWTGLVFILLGLVVRWTAIFTLRRFFTVNVAIQEGHRIVKTGFYGFIRHPSYLGSIVSFVGLAMILGNWIAFIVLIVPITIAFMRRIEIEECVLTGEFGTEYKEYCRATWRLIPWVY